MNQTTSKPTPYELPSHICLPEPNLAFHPTRTSDRCPHPLKGLKQFGPYSRALGYVIDPIRVAVITPYGEMSRIIALFQELSRSHRPEERKTYLIDYPGFSQVFGARAVMADEKMRIELSKDIDDQINNSPNPHVVLTDALTRSASALRSLRTEFDVLLILLPTKWEKTFKGCDGEDFDLHDYMKAVLAGWGIPSQIIREDKALTYPCRCSVMWRIGIALYCKAGGIPWKIAEHDNDTAYVGVSYAVRSPGEKSNRFVTCCSQVFDADGAGLEFIAYDIGDDEITIEMDNPFMKREQMRSVMARSLRLYQDRHAGRVPKRVVIHKNTEFKDEEVDGCFDAWSGVESLDLIRIQVNTPWKGLKLEQNIGSMNWKAANYPIQRGSIVQIGGRNALLWTQGTIPSITNDGNYYKEGKGIPSPLLLERFAGHGGWEENCHQILGLTKMDWNTDSLYDRLPVTIGYAKVLAKTIKRMPALASRPYHFRLFM